MSNPSPNPDTILNLSQQVYPSLAMQAGIRLDVFTPLSTGPKTCDQISIALDLNSQRLEPLLYALVAGRLLTVEDGVFANTPEAELYLSKNSPSYMGPTMQFYFNVWKYIQMSPESIKTGKPAAKHDYSKLPEDELERVLTRLHQGTFKVGLELIERYDFSECKSLVDVGGGTGGLAIAIAEACPRIEATVVELSSVIPLAEKFIDKSSARDRVKAVALDAINESLGGPYDVALAKAFIQILPEEDAHKAVLNIGEAVSSGGRLIIVGQILDDSKISPMQVMGASLLFLNIYDEGRAYIEAEYRKWLGEAGFVDFERGYLSDTKGIITAVKK